MYQIKTEKMGKFTKKILKNKISGEYISIIPEYGGNVSEIVLSKGNYLFPIIDGYKTYIDLINDRIYKNAKLLPFPNRIADGKYEFNGKVYQLPINWPQENHAIHGFVENKEFQIKDEIISDNAIHLIIEYQYHGKIPGYPFRFLATLKYSLINNDGFIYTTEVKNIGESTLPIADGWHPYFKLGKKVDDLYLKIPTSLQTEIDDRMIPTGELLSFDNFHNSNKIGDQYFDTGFSIESSEGKVATELNDKEQNLTIKIWQQTGERKYNFLQIYIPPDRDTIAIEPMTSNTNAFNNHKGLIILEPEEKFRVSCGITVF